MFKKLIKLRDKIKKSNDKTSRLYKLYNLFVNEAYVKELSKSIKDDNSILTYDELKEMCDIIKKNGKTSYNNDMGETIINTEKYKVLSLYDEDLLTFDNKHFRINLFLDDNDKARIIFSSILIRDYINNVDGKEPNSYIHSYTSKDNIKNICQEQTTNKNSVDQAMNFMNAILCDAYNQIIKKYCL